jgi:hypothetical protein
MLGRITSKLRMPDGSINPWVIAVTVTLATFAKVQGGDTCALRLQRLCNFLLLNYS